MKHARHIHWSLLALLLCLAGSATAEPPQDAGQPGAQSPLQTEAPENQANVPPYRFEISGNVAHGSFYMGNHSWGSGFDYGGTIGVRPFSGWLGRLGFEVQLARLKQSEAVSAANSSTLDSRLVSANALYHFRGRTLVQPYVLAGVARTNVDYSRQCSVCIYTGSPLTGPLEPVPYEWHTTDSKMGVALGGGLKIALYRNLWLRTEMLAVNTTAGSGGNYAWLRLQTGVGLHF